MPATAQMSDGDDGCRPLCDGCIVVLVETRVR